MAVDVELHFSSDTRPGNNEIEVRIDANFVTQLAREIDAIDKRFGPDRDVGPVTVELREGGSFVRIGTQKQGDQVYVIDEYGELRASR